MTRPAGLQAIRRLGDRQEMEQKRAAARRVLSLAAREISAPGGHGTATLFDLYQEFADALVLHPASGNYVRRPLDQMRQERREKTLARLLNPEDVCGDSIDQFVYCELPKGHPGACHNDDWSD